jgi:RHS repeat-associated protein
MTTRQRYNNYINGEGFCCTDKSSKMTALDSNIGNGNDDPEKLIFFYHSDHLGSTSYVTNLDGNVVQHVEYIPFGEVFLEEKNNVWNTPYLFNGKELDEETGLYYYGARYYNPRESVWLSVDPLAEKTGTPYQYCYQNPVKFVDMFGMSPDDWQPDQEALKKGKVQFIAEKGDNLQTLSKQTGIPLSQLEKDYGGMTFEEGKSYSFSKLGIVQAMEDFISSPDNSEVSNCRYFAGTVNGVGNLGEKQDNVDTSFLNGALNVSSANARIGDIITHDFTFEEYNFYWWEQAKSQGYTKKGFEEHYKSNETNNTQHFSLVLLKTPNGQKVQNIIEKPGINNVKISPYPGQKTTEGGRNNIYLFTPSPKSSLDKSPIYRITK